MWVAGSTATEEVIAPCGCGVSSKRQAGSADCRSMSKMALPLVTYTWPLTTAGVDPNARLGITDHCRVNWLTFFFEMRPSGFMPVPFTSKRYWVQSSPSGRGAGLLEACVAVAARVGVVFDLCTVIGSSPVRLI